MELGIADDNSSNPRHEDGGKWLQLKPESNAEARDLGELQAKLNDHADLTYEVVDYTGNFHLNVKLDEEGSA